MDREDERGRMGKGEGREGGDNDNERKEGELKGGRG